MSPIYFKAGDSILEGINQEYCPDKSSISISGVFMIAEGQELYDNMPSCDNDFFTNDLEEQGRGCCKAGVIENDDTTKCSDYTGNVNYDMGLKIVDPDSDTNTKYNVCLSLPFRERLPNFKNFIKLIFQILIALIITAIIASCLEFWLKYGNVCKYFYYESDCQRHNPSDSYYNESDAESEYYQPNHISLIDFMFPKRLTFYPYPIPKDNPEKKADENLTGGAKWQDNISEKCDKPYKSTTSAFKAKQECKPGFPYNLIDIANKMPALILKLPLKCFALFFLFSIYIARKFLNFCYRNTSELYKKYVENGAVKSNVFFFVLLWVGFMPVALSILLGQILISPIGLVYNLIVQYLVDRKPEKFINLFSKKDDFKKKFDSKDWSDGFDLTKMGSENKDVKKIADYYKIMNYDDLKNLILFRNTYSYNYDHDYLFNSVEKTITLDYFRSLFLLILYIILIFVSLSRMSGTPKQKTFWGFWFIFYIFTSFIIGLLFLVALVAAIAILVINTKNKNKKNPANTSPNPLNNDPNGNTELVKQLQKDCLKIIRCFWAIPCKVINFIVVFFLLLICVMLFGGLGNVFAGMWLLISKLIYFFFIPLSNFKRFLNIIKQHGNLLTIMLCLNVIIGSGVYLDKAVTSIMSLILAAIVLYKSYMHLNPK